jgi:hypothetical protein
MQVKGSQKAQGAGNVQEVQNKQVAPRELSKLLTPEEQKMVGDLIKKELAAAQVQGSGFEKPGTKPEGGTIVAKYLVPSPEIVARYVVPGPWTNNFDAHVSLINKTTKDHKVSISEARVLRKMFNNDIAEAKRNGKDIGTKVADYLDKALKGCTMGKTANTLIFGEGGPAHRKNPPVYYILPPPGGGRQIYYIIPPPR